MRIIFSGGGTGGHIYPALAIREAILQQAKQEIQTAYIGVSGGMEEKLTANLGDLPFFGVRAQGMPRSLSLKWLSFPLQNTLGIFDAVTHLRRFKPDLVVTTGGFVAFPTLAAARILGIPAVIHEQNAAMGMTNRLFARSAGLVLLTYASAAAEDGKKYILTGNPVRQAFLDKKKADNRFNKQENEFWILSVGGSRGALSLNQACIEMVKDWLPRHPRVKLLHISGDRDFDMVKSATAHAPDNYLLLPYLHEMKEAFDVADIVISRAGATILSELAVCGKPAILVPFPYATDNHQEKNARVLEKMGAAKVVLDAELSCDRLTNSIERLIDPIELQKMSAAMLNSRPQNVEAEIARLILQYCNQT